MKTMRQIIILAGGLGTRLRPITETIPKAMVPVLDKPFVDYQLDWLAKCGLTDVVLSIGYLGSQIQDYVGNGSRWNLRVQYVEEGANLRGTAGALRLVFDSGLLEDRFLVTYGDSFLPIDYGAVWTDFQGRSELALMTVLKNSNLWDTSNACFEAGRVTLYDKKAPLPKPDAMKYIDYGLSAFQRSVIRDRIPSGVKADLADLFHHLSLEGELAGIEVQDRFYEVGSLQGLKDFEDFVQAKTNPTSAEALEVL